jgi:hypothetical protein
VFLLATDLVLLLQEELVHGMEAVIDGSDVGFNAEESLCLGLFNLLRVVKLVSHLHKVSI